MPLTRFSFGIALLCFTLCVLQANAAAQQTQQPTYVSMLQLVTTPEQFEGKLVSVIGFITMNHEGDLLFAHQEDAVNVILNNAVQIEGTKQMFSDREKLDLKYVKILGTFQISAKKKVPFYSGEIVNIRSCEAWSDPDHPASQKIRDLLHHD